MSDLLPKSLQRQFGTLVLCDGLEMIGTIAPVVPSMIESQRFDQRLKVWNELMTDVFRIEKPLKVT